MVTNRGVKTVKIRIFKNFARKGFFCKSHFYAKKGDTAATGERSKNLTPFSNERTLGFFAQKWYSGQTRKEDYCSVAEERKTALAKVPLKRQSNDPLF